MNNRGKIDTEISDLRKCINREQIRGVREGNREFASRMTSLMNSAIDQCEAIRAECQHMLALEIRTGKTRRVDVRVY